MKTTELKDRAGCNAFRYAEASGYSRAYWDKAVHTGVDIMPDRLPGMLEEMLKHRDELNALIADFRKMVQAK